MSSKAVTVVEAATLLRLPARGVRQLIELGELGTVRIGCEKRVPIADIREYRREHPRPKGAKVNEPEAELVISPDSNGAPKIVPRVQPLPPISQDTDPTTEYETLTADYQPVLDIVGIRVWALEHSLSLRASDESDQATLRRAARFEKYAVTGEVPQAVAPKPKTRTRPSVS